MRLQMTNANHNWPSKGVFFINIASPWDFISSVVKSELNEKLMRE